MAGRDSHSKGALRGMMATGAANGAFDALTRLAAKSASDAGERGGG
ncbi:MAG TPA: hypothetical protein VJ777_15950 [Mycobacterium sp.]|nr:hypothetical protein [Mycobacterium sp.]